MSWISAIFSRVGVNLVETVGKVVDDLVTSDEEIALTEIQKAKIKAAYTVRMRELFVELDRQQAAHEENLEAELSERLKLDMKSDSWLSKNIRPMALVFMTVVVAILSLFTIFDSGLTDKQLEALKTWIPFFQMVMMAIYGFYFGSRGLEKISKIRASGEVEKARAAAGRFDADLEPRG